MKEISKAQKESNQRVGKKRINTVFDKLQDKDEFSEQCHKVGIKPATKLKELGMAWLKAEQNRITKVDLTKIKKVEISRNYDHN